MELSAWIQLGTTAVILGTLWNTTKNTTKNIKESLCEFKVDIRREIATEKEHALELARQRINNIEKDVDEMFPRVRAIEDSVKKNCYAVKEIQTNCIRHKSNGTGAGN